MGNWTDLERAAAAKQFVTHSCEEEGTRCAAWGHGGKHQVSQEMRRAKEKRGKILCHGFHRMRWARRGKQARDWLVNLRCVRAVWYLAPWWSGKVDGSPEPDRKKNGWGVGVTGLHVKAILPRGSFGRNWRTLWVSLSWVKKTPDVKAFKIQKTIRRN